MLGPLVYLKGCMIFWEGRRDYPHEAIQEAVSSAIIHSDYSILRDEMISMWRFLMTYWKLPALARFPIPSPLKNWPQVDQKSGIGRSLIPIFFPVSKILSFCSWVK